MALELNSNLKARIRSGIRAALDHVQVRNGLFIDRKSLTPLVDLERSIPARSATRKQLDEFVDEHSIVEVVHGELSRLLLEENNYVPGVNQQAPLSTIDIFLDLDALTDFLVNAISQLPWTYTFTIAMPDSLSSLVSGDGEVLVISPDIRIVDSSVPQSDSFPMSTGNASMDRRIHGLGLLGAATLPTWSGSYLQIRTQGYVGPFSHTSPLVRATSTLKSLVGIGIALRIFEVKHNYHFAPPTRRFLIHRSTTEGWRLHESEKLDSASAKVWSNIGPDNLSGKIETNENIRSWILYHTKAIRAVFKDEARAAKVLLASQWLFDSYSSENELLAFVQAMVCLEILLGDKSKSDLLGLNELLRNRCAYLVGKTQSQRDEILADFSKIYEVRSAIVHSGKSRLGNSERDLFYRLRWLCARTIQEEASLIEKDQIQT